MQLYITERKEHGPAMSNETVSNKIRGTNDKLKDTTRMIVAHDAVGLSMPTK
jgi:hypothetical protein